MLPFLLLLLAAAPAARAQNPQATPAGRASGEKLFRGHCAGCHGAGGAGGSGPALNTGVFYHGSTDADVFRNISEGIPNTAMPDQFFNGVQVWQVVTYVRSLSAAPVRVTLPGDAGRGAALVKSKGCLGCHLVRGEGGVRGPDLSVIGSQRAAANLRESIVNPGARVAPEYWVAKLVTRDGKSHSGFLMNEDSYAVQILDFKDGLRMISRADFKDFGVDRSSIMPSFKDKLTAAELDDVIAYLASLRRPVEAGR